MSLVTEENARWDNDNTLGQSYDVTTITKVTKIQHAEIKGIAMSTKMNNNVLFNLICSWVLSLICTIYKNLPCYYYITK